MTANPFAVQIYNGHQCYAQDTTERISMAQSFTADQCHAALKLPGLQKTVERAIHVRLRKLDKAAA